MDGSRYRQAGGGMMVREEMDSSRYRQPGGGMMAREMDSSCYRQPGGGMMTREEMDGSRYRQAGGDDFGSATVKGKHCKLKDCEPCQAKPCGACGPCLRPSLKTKCKARFVT